MIIPKSKHLQKPLLPLPSTIPVSTPSLTTNLRPKFTSNFVITQVQQHAIHSSRLELNCQCPLLSGHFTKALWDHWDKKNTLNRRQPTHPLSHWCTIGSCLDRVRLSKPILSIEVRGLMGIDQCGFGYYRANPGCSWLWWNSIVCRLPRQSCFAHCLTSHLGHWKSGRR